MCHEPDLKGTTMTTKDLTAIVTVKYKVRIEQNSAQCINDAVNAVKDAVNQDVWLEDLPEILSYDVSKEVVLDK